MTASFPFLTTYDPPRTSEGTLDPLGLYQIADQLAVQLVPAVRERMQRIRFLTAMAVGALVTEGLDDDPRQRDAPPVRPRSSAKRTRDGHPERPYRPGVATRSPRGASR